MFGLVLTDEDVRFDDGEEGFGREVAGLFACESLEGSACVVVLVIFRADVVVY